MSYALLTIFSLLHAPDLLLNLGTIILLCVVFLLLLSAIASGGSKASRHQGEASANSTGRSGGWNARLVGDVGETHFYIRR